MYLVLVQISHKLVRACELLGFMQCYIGSTMEIFRNSGLLYHHSTVFAPKQSSHQKEAMGKDSLKM